jgi:autotransporter-associated beta strand protein
MQFNKPFFLVFTLKVFTITNVIADTGFTGVYAPSSFTLNLDTGATGSSVNTTSVPTSISLTGSAGHQLNTFPKTSYTTTAIYTGTYRFNWAYSSLDPNSFYDVPYFINNGISTSLNGFTRGTSSSPGSATQSGVGSYSISAGNVFGFQVTVGNVSGASTITISDFNWPSNILPGSTIYLSDIGDTRNPIFDGGTLTLLSSDNSSKNFTVNSAGGTVTSPTSSSATFSGVFSGSGTMTFNGTGTTYMNGINTYTGGTTVAGGTLSVGSDESNKSARLAGQVAVSSGATLAGHGGIGGTVTNNGRVAPGGSIGTLSVDGNYVQSSGASLRISITPTANSVLAVSGTASLAGGFVIDASNGIYSKKTYTVLTSSGLSGRFSSLSSNLANYNYSLSYDANNVYLTLLTSPSDTQQSLSNTSAALQGIFALQSSVLVNSLTYDCAVFDIHGVCVSAGGRNTVVQDQGINNNSALLIASYRIDKNNSRIGAYADQNLSVSTPGTIQLGNNAPLFGFFGVWSQRPEGLGAEVKVSAAFGQKNTTITRPLVGTSDPGSGSTNLLSQGAQLLGKYGFDVVKNIILAPYVGIRYTQNNLDGYTEATTNAVTAPLSFRNLSTNATTAIAGAEIRYNGIPQTFLFAGAGVETDINSVNDSYSGTNATIGALNPVNFNPNPVRTRSIASIGANWSIEKNHRLGINAIYRQEAYQSMPTTTVMATYTVGM